MKILIFTVNSWNSLVGDNTWSTLISQYPKENLANICIRDEQPDRDVCSKYFCISENRIIKSVLKRRTKTGQEVFATKLSEQEQSSDLAEHNLRYSKMTKKRRYSMLLARELLWKMGKWKTKELDKFLDDFKPDIILHEMSGYIHLNRIVEYSIKRTKAKTVGYIWDDNFTYKQSKKLGYKIYRYFQRKSLKRLAKKTDSFFAITPKTKKEADEFFNINCTLLSKPLNANPIPENYQNSNKPLKMLYTGNLLIGRDLSLMKVSKALKEVNGSQNLIELNVYTQTKLEQEKLNLLQNEFCIINKPISQKEVLEKQKESDILLFMEDLSRDNLMARLSFSTKITDYLSTGKCVFAIGNLDLAPIEYFKKTNSAIVATKESDVKEALEKILTEKDVLNEVALNAVRVGLENHGQEKILKTFDQVLTCLYLEKNESITN